jgi:Uma2 family endonuclease
MLMKDERELITAHALADSLDLSVDTIWRYTREKKIPYVELGSKQYRYRLHDVIKALSGSAVNEKTARYESDPNKKYTYQDYLELPDEPGYRFEILEGVLVKEPSPNVVHQRVSRRLQRILEDYYWQADPDGEIFNAPLDVTFNDITVVQPDLFYVSGKQKRIVKDARIDGSPTLVVEVLSPSTGRKDRLQKLHIYQKVEVQHYWIVNPDEKTLECFSLRDGAYTLVASGMDEDVVGHPDFTDLSIPLQDLWKP